HSQFPADGAINAALHAASLDDLQEAIDCADRAWREPTWRAMLPHQRAKILHKVADLIEAQLDELTQKQSRVNSAIRRKLAVHQIAAAATPLTADKNV
ncbi:aldehyde dehydrogenase family protein, partial [Klebsiella pneumoniae]|uniref:aldehyde dehydrogenase family protein n=1 Tax=Klebsiella pneumoniae TaxID=573 RepID=UPI003EDE9049